MTTPPNDAAWVRLAVIEGESRQVSMGQCRTFRRVGVVAVQIFVPVGDGTGLAKSLADSVRDTFEGLTIDGVIFRATSLNPAGTQGAWVQFNANTPFQADEIR